ncbi:universal stress protein family [Shewanella denitrificans OS217]|uniref:Universal stress protein family n=1 Tax=Shewanella denitrificans (strain OS217 / ATCC BAA-1090 / DSM 15013) TaxID=318161 RepID=Q12K10_SHEDO|nr:universal stress protein [Shewanella denitrificans]ABE56216.1 universal stress protein family [Shewanella denitrificans OS217]
MDKILVIADPLAQLQSAFIKALSLAHSSCASIQVLAVCYESFAELNDSELDGDSIKNQIIQQYEDFWQKQINQYDSSLTISLQVVWHKHLHDSIIQECKANNYDLIIKTGHRSETSFYTPTDWMLFRDSPIPVYVVEPRSHKCEKVVLVALDALAKSTEKQALNSQLLESAFRLAVQTDAKLHCAYVIKIPTLLKDFDLVDPKTYANKIKVRAQENMAELLADYDITKECIHIEEGEPWGVLANLSKKLHSQCLVVGSMGRKGIVGKLVGNTAEQIIHIARTDLLVIGPDVDSKSLL